MRFYLVLLLCVPWLVGAESFTDNQIKDYHTLLDETRCVTCLNQSLAESTAPIAVSMREEIYRRIELGEDKQQIREYLVSSYGEFVSFRPSMNKQNALLWVLPWVFILSAIFLITKKLKLSHD